MFVGLLKFVFLITVKGSRCEHLTSEVNVFERENIFIKAIPKNYNYMEMKKNLLTFD